MQKLVVVTGTGKGIGLASINCLLQNDYLVAGWGRTMPLIEHPNFSFFPCDVRSYDAVVQAHAETIAHFDQQVWGLINNAGLGYFGAIEHLDLTKWHEMFDTNVHGLMYCTRVVVPGMKAIQSGHIINIASIAGLDGVVEGSGYSATKYAVRGISHSLYKELRSDGIKVSCVYPGSVKTNFFDKVDGITAHDNMMRPEDIATLNLQLFQSHPNLLTVDVEVRPLQPKGPKVKPV